MIPIFEAAPTKWTQVYSNVYSQFGEDGVLREVFNRIGTTNRQCFEVGAADGKWFSNSRRLIDEGWRAVLIEAEPSNWPELDKLDGERVTVVHGKVKPDGPDSLDSILTQCKFDAQPDLGVIDVDGQEFYLWNGMLRFRPRVMVVEYDGHGPANFVPDLNGKGQAGLAAICSIAVSKGYISVATTPTNAIFVLAEEKRKFEDDAPATADAAPNPVDKATATPFIATGLEKEIKIAAILSRPRFGLNVFFDFASEALAPWHIPLQSFYSVFWEQGMTKGMEDSIAAGVDWIITLDFDSAFTARHVQQLIDVLGQNPQIDAIAPLQIRRGRPLPLAVRADGQMPMTGGPEKVATAHFGLTIFRTEAIKRMAKPWFLAKPDATGGWGEGRLDPDIYWWGNWRDSGNSVYVHTGCRIGHIEEMVSDYGADGKPRQSYLSKWRKENGHQIDSLE